MAKLRLDGDEFVVALSTVEKAEAVHGDVRVPVSSVLTIEAVDDVMQAVHGLKTVGAQWPGRFAIGTFREVLGGTKTFAVVHHGNRRGVRVTLQGANFDEIVVSCSDPEEVVSRLSASR